LSTKRAASRGKRSRERSTRAGKVRNHELHDYLVNSVSIEYLRADGSIGYDPVRVIDFDDPGRSDLLVVRQYTIAEGGRTRRSDVSAMQERTMKKKTTHPPGWDEQRVRKVLAHYERLTDEEVAAEDEVAFADEPHTVIEVPTELVPTIRQLIAKHRTQRQKHVR
jgi:hypothetical protein